MRKRRTEHAATTTARAIQIALEHHQAGRLQEAESIYWQVLKIEPRNVDALHLLGTMACQVGQYAISVELFDKALKIKPDSAEALGNRGVALEALERFDEALASYDKALTIKPDYVMALSNRGNVLDALKRYDEALASCDKALTINPDHADAHCNRGVALEALKRYDEALASYDRALEIKPDFAKALRNRGNALQALKRYHEALVCYDKALTIRPDDAEAHWNASLCLLVTGDFERGWKEHEWRWKWNDFTSARRSFPQPQWLGREDLAGKTILLHFEQGLGDTIQFSRYARALARKGARVILEVQPTLKSLLSELEGTYQVVGLGEALPEFDFHCPLLSLPLAFDTRPETIPAEVPYLSAAAAMVGKWERRLPRKDAPRVGIAWSGSPGHKNDRNRSIALGRLAAAFAGLGVAPVSVQNMVRPEDESALAADILHFGAELEHFSDTAAVVSLMDLVISVDTSVAHLAGALGKPVWILLPFAADWRWLADREDSPWYPTAKLFRQPAIGDWDSVLDKLRQELGEYIGSNPATLPDAPHRRS